MRDRMIDGEPPQTVEELRRMYQRTLTRWVVDVLASKPATQWPRHTGPRFADPTNRAARWQHLYRGDILDD